MWLVLRLGRPVMMSYGVHHWVGRCRLTGGSFLSILPRLTFRPLCKSFISGSSKGSPLTITINSILYFPVCISSGVPRQCETGFGANSDHNSSFFPLISCRTPLSTPTPKLGWSFRSINDIDLLHLAVLISDSCISIEPYNLVTDDNFI